MTVAAIGRVNEFPADSYHAQTVTQVVDANGFFSASFSCYGPEVSVCAPGVAITSCVPENSYAAWDGTSMAAPHVTGLAALALAHHPDFRGSGQMRSAARVERLFQIIKQSCQPLMLGDQRRTGFGLPDTLRAVGLAAPQGLPTPASTSAGLSALLGIPALQAIHMGYRDLPGLQAQSAALGMPLGLMSFPFSGGYSPSLNTGIMSSLW
jgi:subtilisin family serine protease